MPPMFLPTIMQIQWLLLTKHKEDDIYTLNPEHQRMSPCRVLRVMLPRLLKIVGSTSFSDADNRERGGAALHHTSRRVSAPSLLAHTASLGHVWAVHLRYVGR